MTDAADKAVALSISKSEIEPHKGFLKVYRLPFHLTLS